MQKLKVYLNKQDKNRKNTINRIKDRMLHSKSYVLEHNYSSNNASSFQKLSKNNDQNKRVHNKNNNSLSKIVGKVQEKSERELRRHKNYHSQNGIQPFLEDAGGKPQSHSSQLNNINSKHKPQIGYASNINNKITGSYLQEGKTKSHKQDRKMHLSELQLLKPVHRHNTSARSNNHHVSADSLQANNIQHHNLGIKTVSNAKKQKFERNAINSSKERSKSASIKHDIKNPVQKKKTNPNEKNLSKNIQNLDKKSDNQKNDKLEQQITIKYQLKFETMFRTRKGVQIMNPNKVNQDRFLISQDNIIECQHSEHFLYSLYAVADGHGPCGHHVSNLIVENLQNKIHHYLKHYLKKQTYVNKNLSSDPKNKTDSYTKRMISRKKIKQNIIAKSLHKGFHDVQSLLDRNPNFNAQFSGSTLVVLLIDKQKDIRQNSKDENIQYYRYRVTCANVGDSRAIVARQINKQNWEIIRLSDDHKPSRDSQKKRIIEAGGRVQKIRDQQGRFVGPLRVWLPKKQIQGLAMTRSIGDNISKGIGVIYQPQILSHELDSRDKFILIASDGVWEFITNYQILTLLIPYFNERKLDEACEVLLRAAYNSWTTEENTVVDDITFVLIFIEEEETQIKFEQIEVNLPLKTTKFDVVQSAEIPEEQNYELYLQKQQAENAQINKEYCQQKSESIQFP